MTYVTQSEMRSLWKSSLENMVKECRFNKRIPAGLLELIKHNLFAKYASYDADLDQIEIGVNESQQRATTYPTIRVYVFPLDELERRLGASRQNKRGDLEFYARILKGKDLSGNVFLL